MNKNHLKNALGKRVDSKNQDTKALSKSAKALVAFGLASLLPSFACADESIKKIQEVFDSQDRDSQKVKKLDSYSPVVDLRSSSLGRNSDKNIVDGDKYFPFFSNENLEIEAGTLNTKVEINQTMTIGSKDNDSASGGSDRWNVTTNKQATRVSRDITINNGAILNINAHNSGNFGYRFAVAGVVLGGPEGNLNAQKILWQGGTININFRRVGYGGNNNDRGGILAVGKDAEFKITSNLKFDYTDENNKTETATDYYISGFVSAIGASEGGAVKLLGNKTIISINQFDKNAQGISTDNRNFGLGGFALYAAKQGSVIYLNAKDDGTVNDKNATIQITGGISTSAQDGAGNGYGGGNIYAHFTGKKTNNETEGSWLKGNVYAGRFDNENNFSTLKMSFTNGATMTGHIVFSGDAKESTSDIRFDNTSDFAGKILDLGVGNHKVTFDATSFTGTIKRDASEPELNSIGVVKTPRQTKGEMTTTDNGIQISKAGTSNSIITFTNTDGKTFGNGTDDIVDKSYNGQIIGDFDMTTTKTETGTIPKTTIKGGTDGSKGFKGVGRNTLTFDFANDVTDRQPNDSFTISGGNGDSIYTLDRFTTKNQNNPDAPTELDLSGLSTADHLYSKIEKAGIKIAAEATPTDAGHLNGTLQFKRTDIRVGTGSSALFASEANILGSTNKLNGLALGANFGNAIWNDANHNGKIDAAEIEKSDKNYRLITSIDIGGSGTPATADDNSSTGDIGNTDDGVKKAINFIFTDETYTTDGNKQGYTGTIRGGTVDSRYVFANAGFINREQVALRQGGELVLFNTAFKGDLGAENKAETITLDFSGKKSGLIGNIVGYGEKNIVFNFTGNTKAEKYTGAVVGDVAKNQENKNATATFTMFNLKTYSSDGTLGGTGALGVKADGADTTIIGALVNAGLTNFNNTQSDGLKGYESGTTNIEALSTTKTTIALRGTSLDASNMTFGDYIYDFAFGSGFTPINGIAVEDSTLSGVIDLSSNANARHRIEFRGDSFADGAGIKVGANNAGNINLIFDDSTATATKTFNIDGLSDTNKLTNGSLKISKTNLVGDLFVGGTVDVDLNFTEGRTWTMSESEIIHKGGNIIINEGISKPSEVTTAPVLKLSTKTNSERQIELINTEAVLKWERNEVSAWNIWLGQKFKLRGTSLEVTQNGSLAHLAGRIGNNPESGDKPGNEGFDLVFAKGSKLQTTKNLNITDSGTGEGNYIAESYGKFNKIDAYSRFNITYVGELSHNANQFNGGSYYENDSKITFINAGTETDKLDGDKIGTLFSRSDVGRTATITLEGTTVANANQMMKRDNNTDKLTYNMTFINDKSADGYVSDKYGKLATTNANGALKESILKVAESKFELTSGLDFKDATYNILFGGENSHNLSDTNFIKGGSAASTITFRNTTLNVGTDTSSSLQNIKGKVIFDLAYAGERSTITGTLGDMFYKGDAATQTKASGEYLTKLKAKSSTDGEGSTIVETKKLVFLDGESDSVDINSYFSDTEVFRDISKKDYSDIAKVDALNSSTLAFGAGTIALKNQDLVFIGKGSHNFNQATTLGNSAGSTLTFIDAGKLNIANIKNGKGTINLVGNSNLDLGSGNALSFLDGSSAGAGLTINAIFTGNNNLGNGVAVKGSDPSLETDITELVGSNANIGKAGEKTIYHLVFDYTDILGEKPDQGFGAYWVYQGNIAKLAKGSVIKFKNAGYILERQIEVGDARISFENTVFGGNFRGDYGEFDYRNENASLIPIQKEGGNVLTSDITGKNLSKKELTFDFTNSPTPKASTTAIQAGYKVALDYTKEENSKINFQNTLALTLGNDTEGSNTSTFIKAIANDIAFGIGDAESTAVGFAGTKDEKSYILSGTELGFQGTNITAMDESKSITEDLYSLNLSFDQRADGYRGQSIFKEEITKTTLTASSIKMGEAMQANGKAALNLSLAFHNKGSLNGGNALGENNTLEVNLKNGARFNLTADSTNGNIGTLILGENLAEGSTASSPFVLAKESSLSIDAGSMNFIGDFTQGAAAHTSSDPSLAAGNIKAHFDGTNKVYGRITGRGNMDILIKGNALFDAEQVGDTALNPVNLTIDASNVNTSNVTDGAKANITLAHKNGTVKVIGQKFTEDSTKDSTVYTALNLADAQSHTILEGAFNIGKVDLNFGTDENKTKTLKLSGNTLLRPEFTKNLNGNSTFKTITLKEVGLVGDLPSAKLTIIATKDRSEGVNLNVINPDSGITVRLEGLRNGIVKDINFSEMNIRGANLELATSILSQQFGAKKFIFASGTNGRGTVTTDNQTLDQIQGKDKINKSALTLLDDSENLSVKGWNFEGAMTFIGDTSIGANVKPTDLKIDGAASKSSFKIEFGFFNSKVEKGSVIFDNTAAWPDLTIYDNITLRGTTTDNLSVQDGQQGSRSNHSTINAVFINDSSMTGEYIDIAEAGLNTTLAQTIKDNKYDETDAGGALTETKLKVLRSKAIDNITMANTVTATMKFIGSDSHSFNSATATSTLSGGNSKSRFDFNHTSVNLGSIVKAGGKTLVYNSKIVGNIEVQGEVPDFDRSSTTLFFNGGQELSAIAQKYIGYTYTSPETGLGINLDLNNPYTMGMTAGKKLGATSKKTNIILMGKGATGLDPITVDGKSSIDLSFLPDVSQNDTNSQNYGYTIIDGGVVDTKKSDFGISRVMFVNTEVYGPRNFAQVGFIDTSKHGNQISTWGGDNKVNQFLIFDFHKGQGYIGADENNENRNSNAIQNASSESRYIFTNFGKDKLVLSGENALKGEINKVFGNVGTINNSVKGYLGLRGVSIEGDINQTTGSSGNGVDIVFNSTGHISYIDKFDLGLGHTFVIDDKKGFNTIANSPDNDITKDGISGYATLGNGEKEFVTIGGNADKDIVFIGDKAVRNGFDRLIIKDGSDKSNYIFHTVGTLDKEFLKNVGLRGVEVDQNGKEVEVKGKKATKGNFTFENSIIIGNINVDTNTVGDIMEPQPTGKLVFKNVTYEGDLSGSLEKELHFAQGSKNITIKGGGHKSKYDFTDVTSIDGLDIDLRLENKSDSDKVGYYGSEVIGFDKGTKSLSGYLRLFTKKGDNGNVAFPDANPSIFAFKDNAKWTVTDQSSVATLELGNTGNTYNLEVRLPKEQASMRDASTQPKNELAALEVGTLDSTGNGRALIHTAINTSKQSESKVGTIKADAFSGTLYVTAKDQVFKSGQLKTEGADAIVLVEAIDANGGEVKGNTVKEGLRYSTTTLEHQERNAKGEWVKVEEGKETQAHQRWILTSFETRGNEELIGETSSLISNSYRMLLIETNNLNKRMGELRDNDYAQGAWIRVFNGMDSGEGTKNFYTNIQLGYDYAFGVIGAKNYTGGAFSTTIADISGNQYSGKGNTYSIALYNSYIADNGLYVDAIAKYLYMDQKLTPKGQGESKFGNHAYSLGAEVGYRVPIKKTNFFIETQGEIVGGIIQGVKDVKLGTYNSTSAWGELDTTPSLSLRAGIVAGYTLKTQSGFRADFRLGASLVSEFAKGGSVVLQDGIDTPIHSSIKNDNKVVLNLGTNLILTDKWRIYIDAEKSFAGNHNTDYQASVGARFSFGKVVKSLPKDEIAPIKLKEEEKKDAQAQIEQEVKKEEVKAEQAPKAEKVEDKKADVKKTEAKKAETKAKKQPAKKQAKKQTKKQAKKPTAKKAEAKPKNTNKPAPAGEKKGGGWGWW